ncbi:hypothetical protein JCM11641_008218 [Rhodosporidiobolus odoratus]
MSYHDQFIEYAPQPAVQFPPPTPISSASDYSSVPYTSSSPVSSAVISLPVPIPRPTSCVAPSLTRSNSSRHHPYSLSPGALRDRPFRPRSATSASDRSDWETDASASFELYSSSVDSLSFASEAIHDIPTGVSSSLPVLAESPFVTSNQPRGKNGKAKSHARKQAPGHIKRPPNAFILFRSHCCAPPGELGAPEPEPPGTAHARRLASLEINNSQHISVIVSQVWKGLTVEEKAYWEQKAKDAKDEHQRLHPDYRYRPQQRPKDVPRRRKRTGGRENDEHREACKEVARQVLEIERTRTEDSRSPASDAFPGDLPVAPSMLSVSLHEAIGRWPEEQDDEAEDESAPRLAPATRKKRTRKPASKKAVASPTSPDAIFDLELPGHDPATPMMTSTHAFFRPHTAPVSEPCNPSDDLAHFSPSGIAVPATAFGTRTTQPPPIRAAYGSHQAVDQFSFMAQLESEANVPQPVLTLDPQLAGLELSRPSTAVSHASSSSTDGSAFNPQLAFSPQLAFNPQLGFFPSNHPTSTFTIPNPSLPRPPSPRSTAIQQMQHYTLGGPSATSAPLSPPGSAALLVPQQPAIQISPTGTTFTFGTAPALESRASTRKIPNPLPLDALKQRRDTLRPSDFSSCNADLMLISPLTTTFNGRKQSTGTWSTGLRRLSLAPGVHSNPSAPPQPTFSRSSLGNGSLLANESFETFTFPQELLESLPAEDPALTAEFFAQFTESTPILGYEPDEGDRPSTASSEWSTDGEVERLEGDLPAGYLERRRSTIVPSKFIGTFSTAPTSSVPSPSFPSTPFSAPAAHGTFHVGSTDFFVRPEPALSSAGPTTSAFATSSSPAASLTFTPADYARAFRPFQTRPSVDAILAARPKDAQGGYHSHSPSNAPLDHPSPDVPLSVTGADEDWTSSKGSATASSMRDTALSILQERRLQHPSLDEVVEKQEQQQQQRMGRQEECEYVYLTPDQLADPELMANIHRHGYGIAFQANSITSPSSSYPTSPSEGLSH